MKRVSGQGAFNPTTQQVPEEPEINKGHFVSSKPAQSHYLLTQLNEFKSRKIVIIGAK